MNAFFDHEIVEQLYVSSRSCVVRARSLDGQAALIVKVIAQEFPSFQDISQFKRAYAIARRCQHPGVLRPLALGQQHGRWTMVAQDIGGVALDQVLRARLAAGAELPPASSQPPLPLDAFFDIALQLCAALDAVHRQGVIHKNINPSNLVWNSERRLLQLIDFGIAGELAQETQGAVHPGALEGTLRYMAPEQTGRMNRRVDYRADYYALGATLYELLSGQAPFAAHDPMALVHCHIAHSANWTHPALTRLPAALLKIVRRLLEKNAEQRYQGLHNLQRDLQACRAAGMAPGAAMMAAPGLLGAGGRFLVGQALHGRESVIAALLAAFGRSAAGGAEMLLVAGFSGVGKSAVINEVHKPIVERRGCFLSGKFDQYRRDVPYASLIQAFQGMLRQLLGEPEQALGAWAEQLRGALGANLALMVELIPELALIVEVGVGVGAGEPVAGLTAEQVRVQLDRVFPRFVAVFASSAHPLVLFLDDLQWADAPTLRMIALFLRERGTSGTKHLLIIGAYRDNEVDAVHPLMTMRDALLRDGVRLSTLVLDALDEAHVGAVLADTLRVQAAECAPLTRLCHRKTGGNPFFLKQFLHAMHDAGHLRYQGVRDCWDWDLAAIGHADHTDNVADLLLEKMRRLPLVTQQLLQLAASVGNRFELGLLAVVVDHTPWNTQQDLWPALDAGLIEPLDGRYKYVDADAGAAVNVAVNVDSSAVRYRFQHDRVQQAAYQLAALDARAANHLRIGRLMLMHAGAQQLEAQLFAIVEQLNCARAHIDGAAERLQLAQLNRRAGIKARRSAAFGATLAYMRSGLDLLQGDGAQHHGALWRDLQLGAAEAAYLCGQFDVAEAIYPLVRAHCAMGVLPLEQVRCIAVQAHQYQLQGRLQDAIGVLIEGLALLHIDIPHEAGALKARYDAIFADIAQRPSSGAPEALLAAGEMSDPDALAAMHMMQGLWMASYYAGQQDLSALMVLSMTRLSMMQGNSDFASVAYVGYALFHSLHGGDGALGYRFGAMALNLARRRANLQTRTLSALMFAALTSHWTQPLRNSDALYDEAFGWALELADYVQVGVVVAVRATERLILGDYLPELLQDTLRDLALMRANGQQAMADCCVAAAIQPIKCLMGQTTRSDSYDDATFSEARFLAQYGDSRLYHAYFLQGKIRNAYLFDGDDAEALAGQLDIVTGMMRGQAKVPETSFYAALIWLRAVRRDPRRFDGAALLGRIDAVQARLAGWAEQGPHNLQAKHCLVQAELARGCHDLALATRCYQQAIDVAADTGYLNIAALANELCGECWLELGSARVAAVFLHDAVARYRQWGADGKVAQLGARHAELLARSAARAAPGAPSNAALDLHSLHKAAQALSNEIGVRRVLARLIAIVRENSGAQVARLLLFADGVFRLEADIEHDSVRVLQARILDLDADADPQFPLSLLRYVIRTGAEVIEDSIAQASRFAFDPYVRLHRPRSVMCLPLRRDGRIDGILYLENRLAEASFTEQRAEFLRMLGAQAMISIAHARLHDTPERRAAERPAQLKDANRRLATLSATDGLTGLANRRHFDEVLRSEWARAQRNGQPLALIMLDVDYFKKYNDRYGHQRGDQCLIRVAHALRAGMRRASDLTARYGGEEFSIVLPNTSAIEGRAIGETLRCAIEQLSIAHERADAGYVTISVGVAVASAGWGGAADADALIGQADAALYRAKDAGRNCVVLSGEAPVASP
ncbi:MAG: diguanylate cyclase [Massilia sp.]|nr:diguanylate cyclase [Massilia sp.]